MNFLIIHLRANCSSYCKACGSPITALTSLSILCWENWRPSSLGGKRSSILPTSIWSRASLKSNDSASIGRELWAQNDEDRRWIEHRLVSLRTCGPSLTGPSTLDTPGKRHDFGREVEDTSSWSSTSTSTTLTFCLLDWGLVKESHPIACFYSSASREDSSTSQIFSLVTCRWASWILSSSETTTTFSLV